MFFCLCFCENKMKISGTFCWRYWSPFLIRVIANPMPVSTEWIGERKLVDTVYSSRVSRIARERRKSLVNSHRDVSGQYANENVPDIVPRRFQYLQERWRSYSYCFQLYCIPSQGFLALEGELTPILVHLVRSDKNTTEMLDTSCDAAKTLGK